MRLFRLHFVMSVMFTIGTAPLFSQTHSQSLNRIDAASLIGFGTATVASGDEVFVSRPGDFVGFPMPGSEAGSVHVFRHGTSGWEEVSAVSDPSGTYGDGFGAAIAALGDVLVVGAPKKNEGRGGAYMFLREDDRWTLVQSLEAPNGMPGDAFGSSIAIQEGAGLIGAPGRGESGSVFAYVQTPNGVDEFELTGSVAGKDSHFGASLSMEGNLALIGAPGPFRLQTAGWQLPPPAFQAGSGFVFQREGDGWKEAAHLSASGGISVGLSVLLVGGEALLGSPMANRGSGGIFRFTADEAGAWSEAGQVNPEGPQSQFPSLFGFTMSRAGNRLVVGAPGIGQFGGGAYVLTRTEAGGWTEEQLLTADTNGLMGFMGNSVAGGDEFIVVGAPGSEFFEGIGFVFALDSQGEWNQTESIFEANSGHKAVIGGEQRCGDDGVVAGFGCQDVELVSFMPVNEVGGARGIMVSDIWGWTDPDTGREYAILGRFNGTSFIDVTDAENPLYLGNLSLTEGATPNLWRDMKVYQDHVYIVADNAGQHGMQVFDLMRLRDVINAPVEFDEDALYTELHSAHNIIINEESGFAYVVGGSGGGETCGGALHMIDLREPKNPVFVGCYADPETGMAGRPGSTHDAQCVMYRGPDQDYAGKEICFNASETALGIGDVSDKDNPTPISNVSYPSLAYSHQGWLSEDHKYFYLNDELDELQGGITGTRTLIWDVQDLDDPVLANEFIQDNPASDHNLYVRGQFMYQSNYVSGLRVFDISDPENPKLVGFFDTVSGSPDTPGFAGSWSNYPFFESGNIIVSSMREGLFVLKKRQPELVP